MGEIKDIADLTIKLLQMKEAKQFAGEILKIQSLASSVQSQQAEMLERDLRLIEENSELRRELAAATAEDVRIHCGVELRKGKRTSGKWAAFCPKCHMPATEGEYQDAFCSVDCGWRSGVLPSDLESMVRTFKE